MGLANAAAAPAPIDPESARLIRLVTQVPGESWSTSLHDLARDWLFNLIARPGAADPSVSAAILDKLDQMGDVGDLAQLLSSLPPERTAETNFRLRVDGEWLIGRTDQACTDTRQAVGQFVGPPWQMNQTACQALGGDQESAGTGLQALHEQGMNDPLFGSLVDLLAQTGPGGQVPAGSSANLGRPVRFEPLHLALLRAAGRTVTPELASHGSLSVLRALATGQTSLALPSPDLQIAAGERAAALNGMTPAELAQIYDTAGINSADPASALTVASGFEGPRGRALLHRAVANEPDPGNRATMIRAALASAANGQVYLVAARLYAPLIAAMTPSPDLLALAPDAVRVLAANGQFGQAQIWADLLTTRAATDPSAAALAASLWPYLRLIGPPGAQGADDPRAAAWYDSARRDYASTFAGRGSFLAVIMEAVGEPVPADWYPINRLTLSPDGLRLASRLGDHQTDPTTVGLLVLASGPAVPRPDEIVRAGLSLAAFGQLASTDAMRRLACEILAGNGY